MKQNKNDNSGDEIIVSEEKQKYSKYCASIQTPSADAVTQNGHKSDTTATNTVCQ